MTPRDFAKPEEAARYDELQKRVNAGREATAIMRQLWHRWNARMRRRRGDDEKGLALWKGGKQ